MLVCMPVCACAHVRTCMCSMAGVALHLHSEVLVWSAWLPPSFTCLGTTLDSAPYTWWYVSC